MYCTFPRHHDVVRRGCARCADGWRLDVAGASGCLDSGLQAQVRAGLDQVARHDPNHGASDLTRLKVSSCIYLLYLKSKTGNCKTGKRSP